MAARGASRDVWDQSYGYHLEVASDRTPGANLGKVISTMGDRDAIMLVAAALALVAVAPAAARAAPAAAERRLDLPRRPAAVLGGRDARGAAHRAPDVAAARVAARARARAAGRSPPALVAGAGRRRAWWSSPTTSSTRGTVLRPEPLRGCAADAVDLLATLPDGALAISDDPGLVWRAGRAPPPTSSTPRCSASRPATSPATASPRSPAEPDVCAVVVRSGERWGRFDDLPDRLAALGYEIAAQDGDVNRVYLKPDC